MSAGQRIAVVGMAGRFPGAPSTAAFWRNLRDGVESVAPLSEAELLAEGVPAEEIAHPDYVPVAATLAEHDLFDARFFGFGAREAALLDPQHRVFLECAWHAMEDAGIRPGDASSGGVFASAGMPAYLMSNLLGGRPVVLGSEVFELQIHNDKDYLATRVAHRLGLTGPAVSVQTACSGSLVAVHQAVRALRAGECEIALAGGVCVRVPHRVGYRWERGMVFSRDGHCRPFDAAASGTVFGNGVGVVVLKRLGDALAAGDRVLAVLAGSAVNNDGAGKVGFTAPSAAGQEAVVRAALRDADFDPETITAVEAHGTATPIGDPIEITALSRAFGTSRTGFCTVGSVKGNVGHLESAAGIAGLIKAVLQLRHGVLAPTAQFAEPNPAIGFASTPFVVRTEAGEWETGGLPRRIGVSAFGIGGTNAHVLLEEAAPPEPTPPVRRPQVLVLSAKTKEALETMAGELAAVLREPDAPAIADVAATLRRGREAWRYRRAVVVSESSAALAAPAAAVSANKPRVVWMFPGQGAQYPGMGAEFYRELSGFAEAVDECVRELTPRLGVDLRELMFSPDTDPARLRATELAQPALFVTSYALARQLLRWDCRADAMVGHSLGELVAACLAGVLSLPDALRFVAERGRLMAEQPPGVMLAVSAAEERIAGLLSGDVTVAAVNAPELCVLSGPAEAIAKCAEVLAGQEIPHKPLHTSHAFHSAMMDEVVPRLADFLGTAQLSEPEVPVFSAVTGALLTDEQAVDPGYWAAQAREPVRFAAALASAGGGLVLEAGPGATLGTFARATLGEPVAVARTMPRPNENRPELEVLLGAVGALWQRGCPVDLEAVHDGAGQTVSLPGYAFARQRYWIGRQPGAPEPAAVPADEAVSRPAELSGSFAEPDTELLRRIVAVWEDVLQYRPIGVHDDFFELGGHSLLAAKLSAGLAAALGREISLPDVLGRPTPAAFAEALEKTVPAEPKE
ncbi:type I polyketide synthase [Amycolatopsis rubida]|uniref:Acyl transferase domain-containing protein n=1 Tax=Amycolatopsis rubida TaxID=112413 RepID=A0A1I5INC6_9PSEU|nr:type I polyketide synthase [Amycolatopsis rubida]SFO61953.1 Acyl transferase domain-containing protein [Amycolatopsis rubida]